MALTVQLDNISFKAAILSEHVTCQEHQVTKYYDLICPVSRVTVTHDSH